MDRRSTCASLSSAPGRWGIALIGLLLATVILPGGCGRAAPITILPLDLELNGPGDNIDDPCFWVDPTGSPNPRAWLFATAKDSGLLEVFELPGGALVGTVSGFGRPNNCDVDGSLLFTTDREPGSGAGLPGKVKVHRIPELTLVRTFGEDMSAPHGIDVATVPGSPARVYVTDSADASVHVYDADSGSLVHRFGTGFGAGIEPVLVDSGLRRIYVARGEKEKTRGVGIFDLDGHLLREFGADVIEKDAEGMAIYACGEAGYLLVADQHKQRTEFEIFDRQSLRHLGTFALADGSGELSSATDGIDVLQVALPGFPAGMLAVCDGCGTNIPDETDVVSWTTIARALGLAECPGGMAPRDPPP